MGMVNAKRDRGEIESSRRREGLGRHQSHVWRRRRGGISSVSMHMRNWPSCPLLHWLLLFQRSLASSFHIRNLFRGIRRQYHGSILGESDLIFNPDSQPMEVLRVTRIERDVDSRFDRNDITLYQPIHQYRYHGSIKEGTYVELRSEVGQSCRSLPR